MKKARRAHFIPRAVLAFAILVGLVAVLYLWGYRSYPAVASWGEESDHSTLVYEDNTYELVGVLGKKGLNLKKYPIGEILGSVEDDGSTRPVETVTFPAETEEGETLKVIPPDGNNWLTLPAEHTYILYSVEEQPEYLLVLESDGEYYLYQLAVEESDSLPEETQ